MNRLFVFLAWSLCFFVLLLAIDQLFVHVRFPSPELRTVQSCYLDFRHRLLDLGSSSVPPRAGVPSPAAPPVSRHQAPSPSSIESAIGQGGAAAAPRSQSAAESPRYG